MVCCGLALVSPMASTGEPFYSPLEDRHLPTGTSVQLAQAETYTARFTVRESLEQPLVAPVFEILDHHGEDTLLWQDVAYPLDDRYLADYDNWAYGRFHSPYPWADRIRKEFSEFTGASPSDHRGHSPHHGHRSHHGYNERHHP